MLSIIIPLRNEYENLYQIERQFSENFKQVKHEVILVNDYSDDNTLLKAQEISNKNNNFITLNNSNKGLGGAINLGIAKARGDYICIMMADFSDDLNDLKKYYDLIHNKKLDAVFGSRFIKGSKVLNYPKKKYILNRVFNFIVSIIFFNKFNDFTNAFKIYRSNVLKSFLPLVSESFNVFLEMPLKVISRGYSFDVISINWTGRKIGEAKFNIKELRSKYLFTLIYCFIEKILLSKKKDVFKE